MVPNGWKIARFDELGISTIDGDRGKNYPKKEEYSSEGYCLFLGADNITDADLDLEKKVFISEERHKALKKGIVQYDDLLLVMRGNGTGRIGLYCQKKSPYSIARINSGLVIIRLNHDTLDKTFIMYLMRSRVVLKQFDSFTFGSAQPQLTIQILKSLVFPVPPLPEQTKIAQILSTWDKAIETVEKLIENSKQQKKALMQQLLTGKKRFKEFGEPAKDGELPEGWEESSLISVLEKIIDYRGQSVPKAKCGIPLITARNVRMGFLDFNDQEFVDVEKYDEWMNRGIPGTGDVLFTTEAPLGNACMYPSHGKYAVGQRTVSLRVDNEKIHPEFLLYFITSERGQRLIDIRSSGSTAKGIKSSELKKVKIRYPGLKEQLRITRSLIVADDRIINFETQLSHLSQQKRALMQQLLTGKRRVKVKANDREVEVA